MTKTSRVRLARKLIEFWNRLQEPAHCAASPVFAPGNCWVCTLRPINRMRPEEMEEMQWYGSWDISLVQTWLLRRARDLLKDTDYEVIWDQ